MATLTPSLLRRVCSQTKATQRRQRATLAAIEEDLDSSTLDKIKSYEELPTPRKYPLLGTLPDLVVAGGAQHYHRYVSRCHNQLGGIYRETVAGNNMVFVSDPAAIRQVFAAEGPHPRHFIPEAWLMYNRDHHVTRGIFFMEGEEWKRNRSVLNRRLLRPGSLAPYNSAFSRVTDCLVHRWTSRFPGTPVPNLERELYRWAIESLGVMVFGGQLGFLQSSEERTEVGVRDMEEFIMAIHGIFKETSAMGTIPPTLIKALRLPMWGRFTDSVSRALALGQELVEAGVAASLERQKEGEESHTLLDLLLREDHLHPHTIVRLLTDLFLAAADTTSHTAIWSLYLLGRHPQETQRVRQEIMAATRGSGEVETEHLASLPYLKGVVKEALRLYPVAPFQTRALHHDTMLLGHLVPAGTMTILSMYTTGRDATLFPHPDRFWPERWLRDAQPSSFNLAATTTSCPATAAATASSCPVSAAAAAAVVATTRLHSHAFIPFGVGVRSCIGRRVAETQLHLLLAKLVARTDIRALNQVDMVMRMVGVTSSPVQLRLDPLPPVPAPVQP